MRFNIVRFSVGAIVAVLVLANPLVTADAQVTSGRDSGFSMARPFVVEETLALEGSYLMELGHRTGVVFSENPDSPFSFSTLFCQSTIYRDQGGAEAGETSLCEMTGAEGDTTWMVYEFWLEDGLPFEFEIIGGTGRWRYVRGGGKVTGEIGPRADHHAMMEWEMEWTVDPEADASYDPENFAKEMGYDRVSNLQTFHGPHVPDRVSKPGNGLILEANSQRGINVSDDPNSPFHRAIWINHDTTVKSSDGEVLGDVLLGTTIDADGDLIFYSQVWWYKEDRGRTHVFSGTGKWKGIEGESQFLDMVPRKDDHFSLKAKVFYKLDEE